LYIYKICKKEKKRERERERERERRGARESNTNQAALVQQFFVVKARGRKIGGGGKEERGREGERERGREKKEERGRAREREG